MATGFRNLTIYTNTFHIKQSEEIGRLFSYMIINHEKYN